MRSPSKPSDEKYCTKFRPCHCRPCILNKPDAEINAFILILRIRSNINSATLLGRAAVKPTLALLRGRLVSRLDLATQLATLAKTKSTDTLLPPKLAGAYPARVVSKLKVWASVDWETYSAATATRHLTRDRVVDENDFLYKATCMRDKATMIAYVAVRQSPHCYIAYRTLG